MRPLLLAALTGCSGECEQVAEPASASQAETARRERDVVPAVCDAAGQTVAGDAVSGRLSLEHEPDRFEVRSWEGRSCDPTVQVWGVSTLIFADVSGDLVRAAGPSLVDHGALVLPATPASWLMDNDLPSAVANPLWRDPQVVASADFHSEGSCNLEVAVVGEGEVHTIDISGQRPLLTAFSGP